ncbi:MAG TPA: hypothetical protein H9755_11815 [Candidatus Dietzia intestinigallinarum]|nr:hypothetical protein [Candidatus Dietzia intestinigallinarum]
MRIRHAASALVALGAASACALGASMIVQEHETQVRESELRASAWSVQASTDFGSTWTAPISSAGGHFPVRVDTAALRNRSAYQPLTLRTTVGSKADALVDVGRGVLVEGNPATAADVRIRAVSTSGGACAAPTFTPGAPGVIAGVLAGDPTGAVPVDAPTAADPLVLPAGTRTTPGAPVTVCLELSLDADSPAPDSMLTLAWPIDITRGDTDS